MNSFTTVGQRWHLNNAVLLKHIIALFFGTILPPFWLIFKLFFDYLLKIIFRPSFCLPDLTGNGRARIFSLMPIRQKNFTEAWRFGLIFDLRTFGKDIISSVKHLRTSEIQPDYIFSDIKFSPHPILKVYHLGLRVWEASLCLYSQFDYWPKSLIFNKTNNSKYFFMEYTFPLIWSKFNTIQKILGIHKAFTRTTTA